MEQEIKELIDSVTEHYDVPVRVGSRCEASTFYRVEDLAKKELEVIAASLAARILPVCHPHYPAYFLPFAGTYTGIAEIIAEKISPPDHLMEVISYEDLYGDPTIGEKLRSNKVALISDVITTARSAVEAHTKATIIGGSVLCWVSIIDRTFGPGPVPVVTSFTGDPVTLLRELI